MGRIIGYTILGLLVGLGVNMYLYRDTPVADTPWLAFAAVLLVLALIGGFVGSALRKRDASRPPIQSIPSGAPKWIVFLFKFIGGLILITATFSNVFPLAAALLGRSGNPFLLVAVLGALSLLVIFFTIGFGSWYMKKWLVSILAAGLVLGVIQFLIAFLSGGASSASIIQLIIGIAIFATAYKYRNFFTGSYISYPIFSGYIIAWIVVIISGSYAVKIAANVLNTGSNTSSVPQAQTVQPTIDTSSWQMGTISDDFDGVNLSFRYPQDFTFDPAYKKITDASEHSLSFLISQNGLDAEKQKANNVISSEDFTTDSGLRATKEISGTGFWFIMIEVQRADGPVLISMAPNMPRDPANVLDGNMAMQIAKTLQATIVSSMGDKLRALTPQNSPSQNQKIQNNPIPSSPYQSVLSKYPVLLYPTGGEVMQPDVPNYITFNPVTYDGTFSVSLMGINSNTSYMIASGVPAEATDKQVIHWTPKSGSYGQNTRFEVEVCKTGTTFCTESGAFTIQFR